MWLFLLFLFKGNANKNVEENPQKDMDQHYIELNKKLDQVLGYLHNNKGTGELGLVADFKQHKQRVESFIKDQEQKEALTKQKIGFFAAVFGFIGGAILKVGSWWFENHLK